MKVKPKPGDLVIVKTTDDVLIEPKSYGIIVDTEEPYGEKDRVEIVFNFYTPWLFDDGSVTASGGPVRLVKLSQLKSTRKKRTITFLKADPTPDRTKTVKKKVKIYEVYLDER